MCDSHLRLVQVAGGSKLGDMADLLQMVNEHMGAGVPKAAAVSAVRDVVAGPFDCFPSQLFLWSQIFIIRSSDWLFKNYKVSTKPKHTNEL